MYINCTIILKTLLKLAESFDWKNINLKLENKNNIKDLIKILLQLSNNCPVTHNN